MSTLIAPLALALLTGASDPASPAAKNLLTGARVLRADEVTRPSVMTDGAMPPEGSFWDTDQTALIAAGGVMVWDLGEPRHLEAALLQGDNNDRYTLELSQDGQSFTPLWQAPPVDDQGMHTRVTSALQATGRYLKLTASGGDGMYSVGELQLFSSASALAAPRPVRAPPPPSWDPTYLVIGAVAVGLYLFLRPRPH